MKRSARVIVERFYSKLTLDFDTNKRVTDEVALVPSKRMRNKIAGFTTHLMRRIERGVRSARGRATRAVRASAGALTRSLLALPFLSLSLLSLRDRLQDNVRGISLKLQEEERERRMDFVPAESAINPSSLVVDPDTKEMLNHLGMGTVAVKVEDVKREEVRPQRFGGPRRDAPPGGR